MGENKYVLGFGFALAAPSYALAEMGGPGALIEPAESVQGLLKLLKSADRTFAGKFFRYNGEVLPW
jgi:hypothetical protein